MKWENQLYLQAFVESCYRHLIILDLQRKVQTGQWLRIIKISIFLKKKSSCFLSQKLQQHLCPSFELLLLRHRWNQSFLPHSQLRGSLPQLFTLLLALKLQICLAFKRWPFASERQRYLLLRHSDLMPRLLTFWDCWILCCKEIGQIQNQIAFSDFVRETYFSAINDYR